MCWLSHWELEGNCGWASHGETAWDGWRARKQLSLYQHNQEICKEAWGNIPSMLVVMYSAKTFAYCYNQEVYVTKPISRLQTQHSQNVKLRHPNIPNVKFHIICGLQKENTNPIFYSMDWVADRHHSPRSLANRWPKEFIVLQLRFESSLPGPAHLGIMSERLTNTKTLPRFIAGHSTQWKWFSMMHSNDIAMKLCPVSHYLPKALKPQISVHSSLFQILQKPWTMASCVGYD